MATYKVKYYLDDMLHTYFVDAENEYEAMVKALDNVPKTSAHLLHDLRVERHYKEWN
jgi:hypothetical protein